MDKVEYNMTKIWMWYIKQMTTSSVFFQYFQYTRFDLPVKLTHDIAAPDAGGLSWCQAKAIKIINANNIVSQ